MDSGVRSSSSVQWWQQQPPSRSLWAVLCLWPWLFCYTPGSGLLSSRPGRSVCRPSPSSSLPCCFGSQSGFCCWEKAGLGYDSHRALQPQGQQLPTCLQF